MLYQKIEDIDILKKDLRALKQNEKTLRIDIADTNSNFLAEKISQL